MGTYRLTRHVFLMALLFVPLLALCVTLAFVQKVSALVDPPIGTTWTDVVQVNQGMPGELNVTWSAQIENINSSTTTLKVTFDGELGFITSQACGGTLSIPWNRVGVTIVHSSGGVNKGTKTSESLVSSLVDYQSPNYVNCWNLANPPGSYPNAISYVRYSGLRFSVLWTSMLTSNFSQASSLQIAPTVNDPTNTSSLLPGTISIPVIQVSTSPTTTTQKTPSKTTPSTVIPDDSVPLDTNTSDTTTPADAGVSADTSVPVRSVDFGSSISAMSIVDVSYNLETESESQEIQRKEATSSSLMVTASILLSSLGTAIPSLGAAAVVGASGGVAGALSVRSFGGTQLLPHIPRRVDESIPDVEGAQHRERAGLTPIQQTQDIGLRNPYEAPSYGTSAHGADIGVDSQAVGRLFAGVISAIQHVSRLRLLRPSLRRWAEIALISPTVAIAAPVLIFVFTGGLAIARSYETISPLVTLLCLFLLGVAAPICAVLVSIAWFVGRLMTGLSSAPVALAESLALLPGLLFVPMMVRSLIGPRNESRTISDKIAFIVAPIVSTLSYKSWVAHFSDVVGSLAKRIYEPLGLSTGSRILDVQQNNALVVAFFMSAVGLAIAIAAVTFSDHDGNPLLMFRPWVTLENPQQRLRRDYVDLSTIEISDPSRLLRFSKICVAGVLTTYALSEILGWKSIVLVVAFLVGTTYVRRVSTKRELKQVHPVVKTVPMVTLGLVIAQFSVSPSKAFVAFAAIAAVATVTSVVRPRSLWG